MSKTLPINRKGEILFTIISEEDYSELSQYQWSMNKYGYIYRSQTTNGKKKQVLMHRQIMNVLSDTHIQVDHKNRIKHDNTRSNLRISNTSQNQMNVRIKKKGRFTSKFKGVRLDQGVYRSTITVNGKTYNLGRFDIELYAALIYDKYARLYFKEFACLNFPEKSSYDNIKYRKRNPKASSDFIGVRWKKQHSKWQAYYRLNNKEKHIGLFESEVEAAEVAKSYRNESNNKQSHKGIK